ncbi:calcium-transporting ATPase 12, plasma membrane-type [Gossypium australe]|uniref:Calcium-transporting ATPase 12, plasma membrane-type n=1 Tax=Gossypium australe TaxID=47621 RepID=A0A5B6UMW3_9ROSI|nr:calcium-transporting ATPase 12, plasma membrane-type [Gossypium australe]
MCAGARNIGVCNEHGDEDTLSVSLLNTTANSSRKNWTRLYNLFLVVGSRIKPEREELSIEEDGSVPKSSSNSGSADCCTIDMVPTEIEEFFIEEDGSVPKSSSTSGSADCSTNDMFAPKIEVFPKEDGSVPRSADDIRINIPEGVDGNANIIFLRKAAQIVRDKDLTSLEEEGGVRRVKSRLQSILAQEIDRSFEEQATAVIVTGTTFDAKVFVVSFVEASKTPTIFLLLVFAALSFTIEMMEAEHGWHDGVAILVAVFMLLIFRSVANYRRARRLQKRNKFHVSVLKDGQPKTITISTLVVGHILCLKKGDFVPADALYVSENGLKLDDKLNPNINRDDNPFLLAVLATVDPDENSLMEGQIDKTDAYMEYVGLSISLLVSALVLINLLVRKVDQNSNIMPEMKGGVSAYRVIKIFARVFLNPRGKVQILTGVLTVMVTSLQHGMPVVITISLSYWKKKMASGDANVQNLSSCGTIGIVSVICFDENTVVACKEVMGSIVGALKEEEVGCKLMSKDELATAQVMAHEIGILNPDLRDMAIENKDLHELAATAEGMNKIAVIGSCKLEDKIRILQRLKQEGHVVAFIGGMATNDDLALKAADVGITICECSTKMARENSEIVISSRNSLRSLIRCLKMGKCAYGNVQTFTQIQLTATLASMLVTLVTTSILDESPITGIHVLWVNSIICILGGLMMVMESYGHQELMNNQPARRMKSLLTKTMWRNVAIRAASDACHLLLLQFIGQAILQINKDVVKTMVFNGFILCQVLDLFISTIIIFARNDEVSVSVVRFMCSSHWFLMASGGVMAMQVVVVELLQSLAEYERLNVMQWGFCFIYAAWLCGTGLTVKLIADSASEVLWSSRSSGSQFGYLRLRRSSLSCTDPSWTTLGFMAMSSDKLLYFEHRWGGAVSFEHGDDWWFTA